MTCFASIAGGVFCPTAAAQGVGPVLRESWVYEVERSFWTRREARAPDALRLSIRREAREEQSLRTPHPLMAASCGVEHYEEDAERWDGLS